MTLRNVFVLALTNFNSSSLSFKISYSKFSSYVYKWPIRNNIKIYTDFIYSHIQQKLNYLFSFRYIFICILLTPEKTHTQCRYFSKINLMTRITLILMNIYYLWQTVLNIKKQIIVFNPCHFKVNYMLHDSKKSNSLWLS